MSKLHAEWIFGRLEAIWHKIKHPTHKVIWKTNEDLPTCSGDIICQTCNFCFWCRAYDPCRKKYWENKKFRVWDKKEKKMFYGSTIPTQSQSENLEIMDYTDKKDLKQKEIYNGDILFNPFFGDYWEVLFKDGCWQVSLIGDKHFEELDHVTFEIVGNVYETPELLK